MTVFLKIVEGIKILHSKGILHLNLSLENIVISTNMTVKIADFEFACMRNDIIFRSEGTRNFRAPEIIEQKGFICESSDVYSLGIILFCLHFGFLPYSENSKVRGFDLMNLLLESPDEFWRALKSIVSDFEIDHQIMNLFSLATRKNPKKRISTDEILNLSWLKNNLLLDKELECAIGEMFSSS